MSKEIKMGVGVHEASDNLLDELTDEQLLDKLEQVNYQIEELDAEAKIIREIFMERLEGAGIDSKIVGDWSISKVTMVKFPGVTLEIAKTLGAIKEAIDTDILKKLHKQNVVLPGVEIVSYTRVSKVKEKKND